MAAQAAYDEGQTPVATLNAQYDAIIGWWELYELASIETKEVSGKRITKKQQPPNQATVVPFCGDQRDRISSGDWA